MSKLQQLAKERAPQYLITKHYGTNMAYVVGVVDSMKEATRIVEKRSKHKGKFRGKAYVRVWTLIGETEVSEIGQDLQSE